MRNAGRGMEAAVARVHGELRIGAVKTAAGRRDLPVLLGVADTAPGRQVDIDGTLFAVVGILKPARQQPGDLRAIQFGAIEERGGRGHG